MKYQERPTELQESAATETKMAFAEHLNQFNSFCDALHNLERNLETTGNDAFKAALLSSGRVVKTDEGAEWQHDVDLMKDISICHRRNAGEMEFAVVESVPLPSGETKEVLNSGHNVREVLQTFAHDQRQVLRLWKDDVTAQMREHLEQKYPGHDMSIVVESFEYKMSRALAQRPAQAQNQSRGVRI
ncbi:MAG TPA: hypothetical protein VIK59_05675 [Verrucomicrobiae bacterium]